MPTYADNYTFRVRGQYIAAGVTHKMKCRGTVSDEGATTGQALANQMNNYVQSFESQLWDDWEWLGWEYANPDSDIWVPFLPVLSGGAVTGTINPASFSAEVHVKAVTHSGRAAGSKARVYWYGPVVASESTGAAGGDGVLLPAELTGLSGATGIANGAFHGGNGNQGIFYDRMTYKVNDDLLKLVRRGILS